MKKNSMIETQLEAWRVPDSENDWSAMQVRVVPAMKKLPAKLRSIGFATFELDELGEDTSYQDDEDEDEKQTEKRRKAVAQLLSQLDKLSVADRKKIFGVLGKDLTEWIEAAWQFLKSAPYEVGYTRTAFRAPKHPEITLKSRLAWLRSFADATADFQVEQLHPTWLAAWAKHAFDYRSDCVSPLLIAAMNSKNKVGDEVFDILYKTVTREHPTGVMADFVIQSLLGSNREKGWEIIEKTLLAAQRQEGLRQSIVGNADLAHPQAFARLLRLIIDHDLIRFSSVARSVDVWLRLLWDSASTKVLRENVESILTLLESPVERKKALADADAETIYRALWVSAHEDAVATVKLAKGLLNHKVDEIRYVGVWVLTQLGLDAAREAKAASVSDANLQVAVLAACDLRGMSGEAEVMESLIDYDASAITTKDCFEKLEQLYLRLPEKPETLPAIVWPWTARKIKRADLADALLETLGNRSPTRMLPYLKGLNSWEQRRVVLLMAEQKKWDPLTRSSMLELAGSASADVRGAAFEALEKQKLNDDEYAVLESYLGRTSADLRTGVIDQLMRQPDAKTLESAKRLAKSKQAKMRLAGLEILRQMAEADRARAECLAAATAYRAAQKKISKEEDIQLKAIVESERAVWSMDDALGLMNRSGLSKVKTPTKKSVPLITKAALACLESLDELVHQNRTVSVRYRNWGGWTEELLGEVGYGLPSINMRKPLQKQLQNFPLWDVWSDWRKNRPAKLRDKDGLELLRALAACQFMGEYDYRDIKDFIKKPGQKKIAQAVLGEIERPKFRYFRTVVDIVRWLLYSEIPKGAVDYLLDCKENTAAHVPDAMNKLLLEKTKKKKRNYWDDDTEDWRKEDVFEVWPKLLRSFCSSTAIKLSAKQVRRGFELERFWDQPIAGATRRRVEFSDLALAYQGKYASWDDLVDGLLGPDRGDYGQFSDLSNLTERNPSKATRELLAKTKGLPEFIEKIRAVLLEIELGRGEKRTVATEAILEVKSFYGVETLFKILAALNGKFKVLNGWSAKTEDSRPATLTALIKATYPADKDTLSDFAMLVKQAIADGYFTEDQLLELAFLAPQWSKLVGEVLKWDGFSEGLYWFLAHMNSWMSDATEAAAGAEGLVDDEDDVEDFDDDDDDSEDSDNEPRQSKLSAWERLILERTPLKPEERSEGAVDVDWFHRTFAILGKKRWKKMADSAKLAANAAQARKAQFLADVLLGNVPRKDLVDGIKKRNLKENVRLLGLLPLAKGAKQRGDIMERYEVLLGYKKYARGLSSLTKPSAMRALDIGMSNLARLAGYPDPLRLEWALEGESIKDLAKGPVVVAKDGVTVTLQLNEEAKPELTVQRGDKRLKTVPAPVKKKHAAIADLVERATELRRKSSRIKQSLEAAMCRGDVLDAAELVALMDHAILAPNLKRIILIGDGIAGYPDKSGKVLRDHKGKLEPIKKGESLRFAHAADLHKLGDWHKWQSECFAAERVQPFKQVFRELYVPTKQEAKTTSSTRFAGHQIGPKQAMALWNSRGWNTQDEVIKIFHDRSLIAQVAFQYDIGTAAEVEGLTMDVVTFVDRDTYKPIKLGDVPAAIFSEVMRDIDLVVSVAHRGEVDPEASESTVEMRATLVRETCQLLGLKNVKFKPKHVVIDGHYGEYSLHLGSGGIHRLPGGSLAIVAVGAQHRGRLFLPFADDDPKTAEIVSKVLLLARDEEIMDPTILDQLGAPIKKRPASLTDTSTQSTSKPAKGKKTGKKEGSDASVAGNIAAVTSGKRRFEFSQGASNKFWEVEISGDSVTTTWGRIGTNGQSKTKQYATTAKAKLEYEKLIEDKTGKGYTEV